ncbi:unnamed protein product, partial [Ascophyllum nodosum]
QAFPSARPSAEELILTLPLIKPRHYSISSSNERYPNRIQLMVGVLKVKTGQSNPVKEGLCSNHLARAKPGDLLRAGTGISPMIGFLQAREEALRQGTVLVPCVVFFGCRDNSEFLSSGDMKKWCKIGVITALHVALSRGAGPKTYVQHLIAKHRKGVWEIVRDNNCHIYVCGDSSMGEEAKVEV